MLIREVGQITGRTQVAQFRIQVTGFKSSAAEHEACQA